jgi:non-ribosomal peptide synthetase component F
VTLLAAFQLLLHRLSAQDDIVVGIAAAEPTALTGKNLLGYTTNLLPLRSRVQDALTVSDYLATVKQTVFAAYQHQNYSVLRLTEKLALRRDAGTPALISVLFNMDYSGGEPEFPALQATMVSHPNGAVECDMFWNVTETDNGLFIECDYNTDLFNATTIQQWLGHYQAVLAALVRDASRCLVQISLVTKAAS